LSAKKVDTWRAVSKKAAVTGSGGVYLKKNAGGKIRGRVGWEAGDYITLNNVGNECAVAFCMGSSRKV